MSMPLRPVDKDALEKVSQELTERNYGFLYVDRVRDQLKDKYRSQEKGRLKAPSLTAAEMREALRDMAEDENYSLERIRQGVFYWDPFGSGNRAGIADRLKGVFRAQMVVTTEDLRKAFDLAHEDTDFFANELRDQRLLMRIAAGSREYYSVGSRLKEETGEDDLEGKLKRRSEHGTISHRQLEEAISVAATSDVIGYLQSEGFIIDMDGDYLVRAALNEYAAKMAENIAEDVMQAFDDVGYVMPVSEYDSLVESEIDVRSNVLARIRTSGANLSERELVHAVKSEFEAEGSPHIEVLQSRNLAVHTDKFDDMVETHAQELTRPILEDMTAATVNDLKAELRDQASDLHLTASEAGNAYARSRIRDRGEELIEAGF